MFYQHIYLKERRSPFWNTHRLFNSLKFGMLLLISFPFFVISFELDVIFETIFHSDFLVALTSAIVVGFLVDFLIKMKFLSFDYASFLPYIVMPIGKKRIIKYMFLKSMFSFANYYVVLLVIPFLLKLVYVEHLSMPLMIGYIILIFTMELCNSLLVRLCKGMTNIKFWVTFPFIIAIYIAAILLSLDVNHLPWLVSKVLHDYVIVFVVALCLLFMYYVVSSYIIKKQLLRLYDVSNDGIVQKNISIGKLSDMPMFRLYFLSLIRCKAIRYNLAVIAFVIAAVACKVSICMHPQMLALSIILCMSLIGIISPAQLFSTCSDSVATNGINIIKQSLWSSFILNLVWSAVCGFIFAIITNQYLLCFNAFGISIGACFYASSGVNAYVRERFDILSFKALSNRIDLIFGFRSSLRYMIAGVWSFMYYLSTEHIILYVAVSFLLSFPFIIGTKVGIDRHSKALWLNKYDYLDSVRINS